MMQQDHEHVEHSEGGSRHDKEVDGNEVGEVVLEECSPGLRGWLRATRHEPGNGALREVEPELEQLAVDARCAPERVGQRHGADEIGKLRADGWSTGSSASGLPGPEGTKAQPVPTNHRLRAYDVQRLAPPYPPLREPHPEDASEGTEPWSLRAAAEQGELLSEREVLERKRSEERRVGKECRSRWSPYH